MYVQLIYVKGGFGATGPFFFPGVFLCVRGPLSVIISDTDSACRFTTNTTIALDNADTATADAAQIIWDNMACQVNSSTGTAAKLKTAVTAVYGITWGRNVITAVSTDGVCRVLDFLRNSSIPRQEYDPLEDFLRRPTRIRRISHLNFWNGGVLPNNCDWSCPKAGAPFSLWRRFSRPRAFRLH